MFVVKREAIDNSKKSHVTYVSSNPSGFYFKKEEATKFTEQQAKDIRGALACIEGIHINNNTRLGVEVFYTIEQI